MSGYREPELPEAGLPDIVAASARKAAIRLALVGLASIAAGAILVLTTVILFVFYAGLMLVFVGLVLEVAALAFWLKNRRVS